METATLVLGSSVLAALVAGVVAGISANFKPVVQFGIDKRYARFKAREALLAECRQGIERMSADENRSRPIRGYGADEEAWIKSTHPEPMNVAATAWYIRLRKHMTDKPRRERTNSPP